MSDSATPVDAAGPATGEIAEQPGNDGSAPSRQDAAANPEGQKPSGVSERINKLVGQRLAAERRAADLQRELEAVRASRQESTGNAPQATSGEPKEADFTDYTAYLEARATWKAEKAFEARFQKQREADAAAARESAQQRSQQDQISGFLTQVESHSDAVPDFQQVIRDGMSAINVNSPLAQALLSSDKGAVLTYFLAANPLEMAKVDGIGDPIRTAIAIARLESRADAYLQSRTRSQAPRQAGPLTGGGSARSEAITGNESMEDFVRKRRAQLKRR